MISGRHFFRIFLGSLLKPLTRSSLAMILSVVTAPSIAAKLGLGLTFNSLKGFGASKKKAAHYPCKDSICDGREWARARGWY
jgi:hypothetical protein